MAFFKGPHCITPTFCLDRSAADIFSLPSGSTTNGRLESMVTQLCDQDTINSIAGIIHDFEVIECETFDVVIPMLTRHYF